MGCATNWGTRSGQIIRIDVEFTSERSRADVVLVEASLAKNPSARSVDDEPERVRLGLEPGVGRVNVIIIFRDGACDPVVGERYFELTTNPGLAGDGERAWFRKADRIVPRSSGLIVEVR